MNAKTFVTVAVAGKLVGAAIASHVSGVGWRDAVAIGALMNTRGLMELILLNIGLDLGVISPALFSMLVLMAIVTTFMTTPLVTWMIPAVRTTRERRGARVTDGRSLQPVGACDPTAGAATDGR